jgi:acetyltransferase
MFETMPECRMVNVDVTLSDGRVVHVRAVSPADEAELLQAFGRLTDDARYMRFMRVVREPNLESLRKVLSSFPEGGIGVVATVPAADGIDVVGSAIAVFASTRASCEFATTVAAAFGGVGLGTALLTALIDEATRHGLKEMEGFVLTQNKPMLRLARRLGFDINYEPGNASVSICRMALGSPLGCRRETGDAKEIRRQRGSA